MEKHEEPKTFTSFDQFALEYYPNSSKTRSNSEALTTVAAIQAVLDDKLPKPAEK